jgi:hypothetical protein
VSSSSLSSLDFAYEVLDKPKKHKSFVGKTQLGQGEQLLKARQKNMNKQVSKSALKENSARL